METTTAGVELSLLSSTAAPGPALFPNNANSSTAGLTTTSPTTILTTTLSPSTTQFLNDTTDAVENATTTTELPEFAGFDTNTTSVQHFNTTMLAVIIVLSAVALVLVFVSKKNKAARRYGGLAEAPVSAHGFRRSRNEAEEVTGSWMERGVRTVQNTLSAAREDANAWTTRNDYWEHRLIDDHLDDDTVYRPTSAPVSTNDTVRLEFNEQQRPANA